MQSHYQRQIAESGLTDRDPRHVEAWMRVQNPTLDHLGPADFESEICIANICIAEVGEQESEALAVSYGF